MVMGRDVDVMTSIGNKCRLDVLYRDLFASSLEKGVMRTGRRAPG